MRLLNIAVAVALSFSVNGAFAQGCTPPLPATDLITPGTLEMAINPTLPPQQFVDANGDLKGLNVDLGQEIAKRRCLKMSFVRMDFPAMCPALSAARFDGIDTGMFWTDERSRIAYTVPYAMQAISVFVLKNSALKFPDAADLAGHSAGVEVNSYQERWVRGLAKDIGAAGGKPIDIHAFTTATDVLAALKAGQVEVAILIDQTAREMQQRGFGEIDATGLGGAPTTLVFRNKAVAAAVANVLNDMRADGYYDALFDKYGLTRFPKEPFAIRGPGPG
jgi:polar amino acid transport system substrate-binding protein